MSQVVVKYSAARRQLADGFCAETWLFPCEMGDRLAQLCRYTGIVRPSLDCDAQKSVTKSEAHRITITNEHVGPAHVLEDLLSTQGRFHQHEVRHG